ncbi:MFS transporter [Paraburkholderia hospita]|uniref:MFS transporter n=1 Tax=Paraburkholderia hospita TaxID=169430 RepID=UPI000B348089|nr:MFS transporter [Paraburkholderia hospita]OUL91529.1 MFS transporter [Paraburkholderia hospita]
MRTIDLHQVTDNARLNSFHWNLLFWCALMIVFDGYDLAVAGIALPSMMKDLAVPSAKAGAMVSAALFGMMFGNVLFGSLSSRIGRRRTIALCLTLFSVFTAAAGLTHDPITFSASRFIAGLGMGGVMPNVVAHMTEYSPRRVRSTMVTLMFSGYSIGGVFAALLGKGLIETHGWQSVFLAAGLPVLLVPFVLRALPESMPYLLAINRSDELKRLLVQIDSRLSFDEPVKFLLADATNAPKAVVSQLFDDGRAFSTLMFWLACFMCLFMVYALSSWLVKLMTGSGYGLGSALTFIVVLNLGAVLGAVGGGWLADRFHIKPVLIGMYVLAALSIALLGYRLPMASSLVLVALAGAATIGNQIVTIAYAGQYYPTAMRATGVGFSLGVGRLGAITAPVLVGALVGMELPLVHDFYAIAIPAVIAAIAIFAIDHRRSASSRLDTLKQV